MMGHEIEPRALARVHRAFHPGMFGRFQDVVAARIDLLSKSRSPHRLETVRFYRWLLETVDAAGYAALQKNFLRQGAPEVAYLKYLDPIVWFEHKLKYARLIGLDKLPPQRILDIGTGAGHFLLVARFFGHQAIGTELPAPETGQGKEAVNQRLFDGFAQLFGNARVRLRVEPLVELAGLPGRFDLVTAFSAPFDRPAQWNRQAWTFLLESLERHVLTDRGQFFATVRKARLDAATQEYLAQRSKSVPSDQTVVWIERFGAAPRAGIIDVDRVAALHRDLPYLEAYREHTDLQVGADPREAAGGRWDEVGRLQFEYLVANGLAPRHRLLDIGCGTLRGGRHFIGHLLPARYTGVDISSAAIVGALKLVAAEGLKAKRPRLIWNKQPERWFEPPLEGPFDRLLAHDVFTHLDVPHIEACFACLDRVMGQGARFFFTFDEQPTSVRRGLEGFGHPFAVFDAAARRHGFTVEKRSDYPHPLGRAMAIVSR